jgi:hypothetical protein
MKHNYEDLFKDQLEVATPVTKEMIDEMIATRKQNYTGEELELSLKTLENKAGKKLLFFILLNKKNKIEMLRAWCDELESLDAIVKDGLVTMSGAVPRFESV